MNERALAPYEYEVLWRVAVEPNQRSTSYDVAWSLGCNHPHYGKGRNIGTIFRSLRRLGLVKKAGDGFWALTARGRATVFPVAELRVNMGDTRASIR